VNRTDRICEILNVATLGFISAVPLACLAAAVQRVGWHALPLAYPLYCAWAVGRQTARTKWMREYEAQIAAIDRKIDAAMQRSTDEETKGRQ